jgi:hypothetical protein
MSEQNHAVAAASRVALRISAGYFGLIPFI